MPARVVGRGSNNTPSGTSVGVTLDNAPASGDKLLAFCNISQFAGSADLTVPTGWSAIDSGGVVNADNRFRVVARNCDGTEGTSLTFNFTVAQTHAVGVVLIRGNTSTIAAFAIANAASTSTSDAASEDLAIAAFIQNDGTSNGNSDCTVATANWVTDISQTPGFHSVVVGHAPPTIASATIAPTCNWTGTVQSAMAAIVVVQSATSTAPRVVDAASGNCDTGTSITLALQTAPSSGDVLLAGFNISQFTVARDLTMPAGWGGIDSLFNVNEELLVVRRICDGTESSSVTFNFTGTAQTHSAALLRIKSAGQGVAAHTVAEALNTSLTAPFTGDLPVAFFVQNNGTTNSNIIDFLSTAGWSTDCDSEPTFHGIVAGHGPLTTAAASVAPGVTWEGTVSAPQSQITVVSAPGNATPYPRLVVARQALVRSSMW